MTCLVSAIQLIILQARRSFQARALGEKRSLPDDECWGDCSSRETRETSTFPSPLVRREVFVLSSTPHTIVVPSTDVVKAEETVVEARLRLKVLFFLCPSTRNRSRTETDADTESAMNFIEPSRQL